MNRDREAKRGDRSIEGDFERSGEYVRGAR